MKKLKKAGTMTFDNVNMDCLGPDVFRIFGNQLPCPHKEKIIAITRPSDHPSRGASCQGSSALFK